MTLAHQVLPAALHSLPWPTRSLTESPPWKAQPWPQHRSPRKCSDTNARPMPTIRRTKTGNSSH